MKRVRKKGLKRVATFDCMFIITDEKEKGVTQLRFFYK